VDYFLAALHKTTNVCYMFVIQHYLTEKNNEKEISFHEIERRLLAINEMVERDTYSSRKLKIASGLAAIELPSLSLEQADVVSTSTLKCYNCGKEGHKAVYCT
jgi:hypothetical protein